MCSACHGGAESVAVAQVYFPLPSLSLATPGDYCNAICSVLIRPSHARRTLSLSHTHTPGACWIQKKKSSTTHPQQPTSRSSTTSKMVRFVRNTVPLLCQLVKS